MSKLIITQELLRNTFDLDDQGNLVRKFSRGRSKKGTYSECKDRYGYVCIGLHGKVYRAHRLVWMYVYGYFPDKDIDHINGIRSDNRPENLRVLSRSENKQNQAVQRNNKTGVKGVFKVKGKFIAEICHEGKSYYIGCFDSIEDASTAYNEKAKKLHKFNRLSAL